MRKRSPDFVGDCFGFGISVEIVNVKFISQKENFNGSAQNSTVLVSKTKKNCNNSPTAAGDSLLLSSSPCIHTHNSLNLHLLCCCYFVCSLAHSFVCSCIHSQLNALFDRHRFSERCQSPTTTATKSLQVIHPFVHRPNSWISIRSKFLFTFYCCSFFAKCIWCDLCPTADTVILLLMWKQMHPIRGGTFNGAIKN